MGKTIRRSASGRSRQCDKFPHIYGPINHDAVTKTLDMERNADDVFVPPDNL
jgi:uncharacterized protein (DUF952 family)